MLFDMRIYSCRPGTLKKHLALYEEEGFAVQKKHLGPPLLYGITETGPQNSYVHVWVYRDAADRARRRAAMEADPAWQAYRKVSSDAGYLVAQENRLLVAAPFFDSASLQTGLEQPAAG
jgi:hypothetical protein